MMWLEDKGIGLRMKLVSLQL